MTERKGAGVPRWVRASDMYKYIPEVHAIVREDKVTDWLSKQAIEGNVTRRPWPEGKPYDGLGRPPQYQYYVPSVRAYVKLRDRKSTRLNSSHLVISYA